MQRNRILKPRSQRLKADAIIRAIEETERKSTTSIEEVSIHIQKKSEELQRLIEENKTEDYRLQKRINDLQESLSLQIDDLKQMIRDHEIRVQENKITLSKLSQTVEAKVKELENKPSVVNNTTRQEIIQTVDTTDIRYQLRKQKQSQKVIAEFVKYHQQEQDRVNQEQQAKLDRIIANFIKPKVVPPDPRIDDNVKAIEGMQDQIRQLAIASNRRIGQPSFAHLESNYYNKKYIDEAFTNRVVTGKPNSVAFYGGNSALSYNHTALYFDDVNGILSVGTDTPYKDANLFVSNIYNGVADSYGAFVGKTYDTDVNNSAFVGGLAFVVQSTGSGYLSGQVKGLDGIVFHGGTNTANQLLGGQFLTQKTGTGPITTAYGANYAIMNTVATGAITTGIGINIGSPISTGPITSEWGILINNQGGANITNAAGILILDQSGASTLNYAIYAQGGKVGFNQGQTNAADFNVAGQTDANTFYVDVSQNAAGFGTSGPLNKVDIAGSVVIGSAYAGTNISPSQGLLVEGNISIGTTDYTAIPGASATVFSIVSRVDSANNSAHGGMYFRTIMNGDNQETFGNYNLISTSGMTITSGTHILGAQNELYLQNNGNSAAFDNAAGVLNFIQANGDHSHANGINNIIYGSGNSSQTIGVVNIMPTQDGAGTHAGMYTYMASINSTANGTYGGHQAVLTWSSPSATILANVVSAFGMGAVNNPTQKQVGMLVDWNVPGTDSNFAKWGVYVNSTQVDSAKTYFGDSVMLGKKPYVATGTNKPIGVAALASGSVDVSCNTVTNSTVIILTPQNSSGTAGSVYVAGRTAGTGFTVTSTLTADTRNIGYMLYEMTP